MTNELMVMVRELESHGASAKNIADTLMQARIEYFLRRRTSYTNFEGLLRKDPMLGLKDTPIAPFGDVSDEAGYDMLPITAHIVNSAFCRYMAAILNHLILRMQMISGSIVREDMSYKLLKHIHKDANVAAVTKVGSVLPSW